MINLIRRNTPSIAKSFILETIEKENGKSVYQLSTRGGKIVLGGDCKISQAMAYYRYLKEYCRVNISHCGNLSVPDIEEAPLPEREIRQVIVQEKRAYMNYRTFGYSCAWWGWEEWEREIDFMAMNGINMPLSLVGTEAVWFYTLRELKYSENGALRYISGPAFWPWQLTGNLCAYFPLADKAYVDARLELGRKIIEREAELGMTPVLQGFCGEVPRSIGKLFKSARLRMIPSWHNFPATTIIEPSDPLFRKIGTVFLEKQRSLFGTYHYYISNPFFDNKPNSKKKDYLWNYGRAVDNLLKSFDSDSVWVMQSQSLYEQMAKSVPKGRLLVFDIDGTMAEKTDGFYGHDFITGKVLNYGDHNALNGSIKELASNNYTKIKEKYENVCGTGLFPEGIRQNPLLFEFAFRMLTESKPADLDEFARDYASRRYGSDEECLYEAVKLMIESCYSPEGNARETGSIICARPSTKLLHAAPGDTLEVMYDNKKLLKAAELLLEAEKAGGDGYEYDVCDVVRQVMSNYETFLYSQVIDAFYKKDVSQFERSSNMFMKILEEVDALLRTREELTLNGNLKKASACALSDKEKQNFELNLLCQITLWGPVQRTVNYDCGWKEWGGMIDTYYSKRWHSFFEQLAVFFKKKNFKTETRKQFDERNDYAGSKLYKNFEKFEKNWLQTVDPAEPTNEDTVETARQIIKRYAFAINENN